MMRIQRSYAIATRADRDRGSQHQFAVIRSWRTLRSETADCELTCPSMREWRIRGAEGGTRTPTGFPTTPSRWRVCQFHHFGTGKVQVCSGLPYETGEVPGAPPAATAS